MQSARDPTVSSISSSSSSRSLLTRLSSPFSSKPKGLSDFHIKLEDDGRQYFTRDTIRGSVKLRVHKPTRITHLAVSLAGRAQVYKNPITPGESPKTSAALNNIGRGKNTGQYHGNGLATLFEEEIVLCGDGRLADGTYQFNFELDFPDRDLPSSVDFERGKIWYVVVATLTRPTTIAPVSSCEREVTFTERIDIAPLYPPKPRTIILDPISKRSKAKTLKRIDTIDRKSQQKQPAPIVAEASESSVRPSVSSQDNDRSLSPVPSEQSIESHVSSSVGLPSHNGGGSIHASPAASFVSRPGHGKTIGTTMESCSGGCLRGDILSVKITVHHTKYMKSMHGIIVTLYRHARVDTQPALAIGPLNARGKSAELKSLPQSRSGLSGLSLSGAGTAHIFRKDLAQTVCPLVVNPQTLTADVVVKLRVPEDAFPTIAGVPGTMISFKYYVEVIVDIQGKLASSAIISPLNELSNNTSLQDNRDWSETAFSPSRIIDTGYVRRDRAVVCGSFELIIGTVDSERKKGKRKVALDEDEPQAGSSREPAPAVLPAHPPTFESVHALATPSFLGRRLSDNNSSHSPDYTSAQTYTNGFRDTAPTSMPAPPLPQLPDESQLSEKERIRLAEARLLPSQPPGMDDDLDDDGNIAGATAPRLDEDYADTPQYDRYAEGPEYCAATSSGLQVDGAGLDTRQPYVNGHEPQSSDQLHYETLESLALSDDGIQNHDQGMENAGQREAVPANDVHDSHAEASASADLPRYER